MSKMTNVIMYVQSQGKSGDAVQALRVLQQMPGIQRVRPGQTAAKAILVDYDHARISAAQMLAGLRGQGVTACLVGM